MYSCQKNKKKNINDEVFVHQFPIPSIILGKNWKRYPAKMASEKNRNIEVSKVKTLKYPTIVDDSTFPTDLDA